MPIAIREKAFSFAASVKLENDRNTGVGSVHELPGSVKLQTLNPLSSRPKNGYRASAPAPPSVACPES